MTKNDQVASRTIAEKIEDAVGVVPREIILFHDVTSWIRDVNGLLLIIHIFDIPTFLRCSLSLPLVVTQAVAAM